MPHAPRDARRHLTDHPGTTRDRGISGAGKNSPRALGRVFVVDDARTLIDRHPVKVASTRGEKTHLRNALNAASGAGGWPRNCLRMCTSPYSELGTRLPAEIRDIARLVERGRLER